MENLAALDAMFTGEWSVRTDPTTGAGRIERSGKMVALFGGDIGAYEVAVTDATEMLALIQHLRTMGGKELREAEVEGQSLPSRRDFAIGLFTLAVSLVAPGCAGFKGGVLYFDETGTAQRGGPAAPGHASYPSTSARKAMRVAAPAPVPDAARAAAAGTGDARTRAEAVIAQLEAARWAPLDPTNLDNLPRPADWTMGDEKQLEPAMRRFLANPRGTEADPRGPLNVRFAAEQKPGLSDDERADVMLDYQLLAQAGRLRPRAEVNDYARWRALVDRACERGALDESEALRLRALGAAWSGATTPIEDTSDAGSADRRFIGALRLVQLTRMGHASESDLEAALTLLASA